MERMCSQESQNRIIAKINIPNYRPKISRFSGLVTLKENNENDDEEFKARPLSRGIITSRTRHALLRPPNERDEVDVGLIWSLFQRSKAFWTYSLAVRKELAKIVQYENHDQGSVVLKEGQFGTSFYFIIKGTVAVELSTLETGGITKQIIQEKIAGESFGETVAMSDSKKTAAIICKTACEFLRVENSNIDEVLKMSYHLETEKRMKFLHSLDLFEKWVQSDIKLLSSSSRIVEHVSNTVIIRDMREAQDYSYFIMSGQCQVVRQISVIVERLPFGKEKISLAPVGKDDEVSKNIKIDRRYEKLKNVYLVVQVLKEGQYFGVDEDIGKSSVITTTKTEFLRIPKSSLQAQQRGSFFKYINSMAMKRYPNRIQTFQRYTIGLKWDSYKKGLVEEVTNKRVGRLTACAQDVPRCLLGKS